MTLTQELRQRHDALWEQMVAHPFVEELVRGTLPREKFRIYFLQDYLFLDALVQTVALAIAKAPDFDAARHLEEFLRAILAGEDALFRDTFQQLGMAPHDYKAASPAPTTLALSSYLVRVAYQGSFLEIVAALTASEWTYYDWAARSVQEGRRPADALYQGWIDIHASQELGSFVSFLRGQLDGAELTSHQLALVEEVFATVLRCEVRFWNMAYHGEGWD